MSEASFEWIDCSDEYQRYYEELKQQVLQGFGLPKHLLSPPMPDINSTERAFLWDIVQHSEDDGLRLIFADWLAENGQEDRAEFIRVELELAEIERGLAKAGDLDHLCRVLMRRKLYELRKRQDELHQYGEKNCGCRSRIRRGERDQHQRYDFGPTLATGFAADWCEFQRGLAEEIEVRTDVFTEEFAREVFGTAPIKGVKFTNIRPYRTHGTVSLNPCWYWLCLDSRSCSVSMGYPLPYSLPEPVFYLIRAYERSHGWDTKDLAELAASNAAVKWGRSLVGLT